MGDDMINDTTKLGIIVTMTGVTLGACTVIPENAAPYHYRQNYYQSQDYSNDLIEPQENYQNYFREPNQVKKYRRMLKSDPQASDPYLSLIHI